jgi:hypothetical protein
MSYEYLVASLPMLFPGDPPPFGVADFLYRCAGVLSPEHHRTLERLLAGRVDETDHPAAREWAARDIQLRNAVAQARATAWQADARPHLRDHPGFDGVVRDGVADALTKPTPLERERALDRCRWRVLDEIALGDAFGMGAVVAFAMKLQIASRWAGLTPDAGGAALESRLEAALAGAAGSPETPGREG